MKRLVIYSFMSLLLIASACRKSDNVKLPGLSKVPYPLVKKDLATDLTISAQTPDAFNAKFSVGLFFPNGDQPTKFDVVIRKNEVNASTKTFKADVTTFPTVLTVTGVDLKTLFGATIVLGDKFDIGVDITTKDGKKYQAFPIVGVGYSPGAATPEGAGLFVRYEAVCKYTAADYAGTFKVTEDGWNDFGVGAVVPITVVNDHQLSFVSPVNGLPIIIDVDVNTNETSVAKQAYGDYKAAGIDPTWTYGVASVESIKSVNNFVAPCDLVLSLQLKYTVAAGNFGDFTLKMQKQ